MAGHNRKLRVLHVVDGFRMGGAEAKLAELIERTDSDRFQTFLANVGPTGPLESRFRSLAVPIFNCQRRHRFDLRPVRQLAQIIREQQIDIVQNTLFWADFVGSLAARYTRVPVVLSWETVTHAGDPYHAQLQRRAGYQLAMRYTDKVIAVSHEIKASLMQRRGLPAEKIEVIHYGVDLEKYVPLASKPEIRRELSIRESDTVLVVTARLEEVKGHRYFLDAFQRIANAFAEASVLFVGDGSCRAALERQIGEYGLEKRIRLLGIRPDVHRILNAADIFVLPSIAGEGLPNVVLEAMACGKPVVATDVGGTAEAVVDGENGYVVPPRDVAALADALHRLMQNPEQQHTFGRASRERAEQHFSLDRQIQRFTSLYLTLYAQKTDRRLPTISQSAGESAGVI